MKKERKKSTFWQDFKAFISRGNIIDLAVGLVVGAAFTAIVNSVVNAAGTVYTDTSLKEVYLPSTLTKIHSTALSGNRISDIYFTGSEEQWNELYFFEMQKSEDDGDEYEEVRLEKSDVLSDSVTVHFNAEYPSLK